MAVLGLAAAMAGCAGADGNADDGAADDGAAEAALTASAREISPSPKVGDVVTEFTKLATAAFNRAKRAHPSMTNLTRDNFDEFASGEGNLNTLLGTFLSSKPSHEVATANALREVGAFASEKITTAAGPDGLVGHSLAEVPQGLSSFFSIARDGLARDMLRSILKSSSGLSVGHMLDEWTRIEKFADVSFTPYAFSGTATQASVARLLGIDGDDARPLATGPAAVDGYAKSLEEAGGRFLDDLTSMWKAPGVKQQLSFEYGDDGIGGIVLAIVDEHDQLFVYTINLEV